VSITAALDRHVCSRPARYRIANHAYGERDAIAKPAVRSCFSRNPAARASTLAQSPFVRRRHLKSERPGARFDPEAAIEPGIEVLDVATGAGNTAIEAPKAGTRVAGLDLAPLTIIL